MYATFTINSQPEVCSHKPNSNPLGMLNMYMLSCVSQIGLGFLYPHYEINAIYIFPVR